MFKQVTLLTVNSLVLADFGMTNCAVLERLTSHSFLQLREHCGNTSLLF